MGNETCDKMEKFGEEFGKKIEEAVEGKDKSEDDD